MARNFLTPINLSGLELQDAAIQGKTTAAINAITPASGGRIYYDSQTNVLKLYNGSGWVALAAGGSTFTLGSTSIAIGGTTTTVAGLTLSGPTFTGTITTSLTTAGYVTTTSGGVLGSVATIPNAGLTNSTISGKALGTNLDALTISTGLTGSSYNGSSAVTIALATAGTAGTYTKVTTDAYGRVTSGATLSSGDIPSLGNISNSGAIGSTSGLVVSTTTAGVLVASSALPNGTTATTQAAADNTTKVATTAYVDTAVQNGAAGFNVHAGVEAASTTNITGTYTAGSTDQSQGTGIGATFVFTAAQIDGVTLATTNRVLLKNQTTQTQNGVYVVTTVAANITLTRASDFDNSVAGEVSNGDLIYIEGGGQGGTTWIMNAPGTATTPAGAIRIGTDNITFAQFAGAGTYTGTNGVTVSGTTISGVNATTTAVGVASFPAAQFTVSSGAVTLANISGGIILSGTVADARIASALTGKTYNGLTLTAGTTGFTVAGGTTSKTLNVINSLTFSGTDGSTLNIGGGGTLGTGAYATIADYAPLVSPSFTTPTLGVATATSINKVAITAPATSATLTLANGSTLATAGAFSTTLTATATTALTLPTTGTLATLAGSEALTNKTINGLTVTSTTGTLTLVNGSTLATAGAFSTTLTATGTTNVTLPTSGTLMTTTGNTTGSAATLTTSRLLWGQSFNGSAAVTGALTGATSITGTAGTAFIAQAADYASTTGQGPHAYLKGGYATAVSGTAQGGNVYVWAGGSDSGTGTAGSVNIGAGETVLITGTTTITGSTTLAGGTLKMTGLTSGTSQAILRIDNSTGQIYKDASTVYLTSATGVTTVNGASGAIGATANSNGAITRYYRATNATGTTTTINHALGQWVIVQVYKTSDGTIVEADIANTSTSGGTTTVTFAASQTAGDYTIVIIG